ncbi:MAG TPA: aminotransferase class I/II-fold pyridoxal phosphate-dependent enzyme [Burkholderiaceae bacterium]|nr:aminotransferase class I/II-fold pyridoxal phosphate-dependent enzyme [Burkholderiaceae bacterium]
MTAGSPAQQLPDHGGPDARGPARWDFSTNAHAGGPEPAWLAELAEADPTRYPDPTYTALREALGALHGVAPARILPAASGSEAIVRISTAVALGRPGAAVRVPQPAYGDYARAARACGLDVQIDADVTPAVAPALTWAAEPGSPCGDSVAPAACGDPAALQVIDRAYAPLRLDGAEPLLPSGAWQLWSPNKALALTGVRGAYLVAPPAVEQPDHPQADWARRLQALAPSWPLGAQAVAMLRLWARPDTQAQVRERLAVLRDWKRRQLALYDRLGWSHRPSVTPFGVVAWPGSDDALRRAAVLAALREQGVQLRDVAGLGLSGWLRLSVQPPAAQDALERAWRQIQTQEGRA